ncbi:hypothetical protein C8R44DRAFT_906552 [Mycena epipterygia]|nr:hypothetical protein C8R44DRAFT_906552 [Mycena epipterygia]
MPLALRFAAAVDKRRRHPHQLRHSPWQMVPCAHRMRDIPRKLEEAREPAADEARPAATAVRAHTTHAPAAHSGSDTWEQHAASHSPVGKYTLIVKLGSRRKAGRWYCGSGLNILVFERFRCLQIGFVLFKCVGEGRKKEVQVKPHAARVSGTNIWRWQAVFIVQVVFVVCLPPPFCKLSTAFSASLDAHPTAEGIEGRFLERPSRIKTPEDAPLSVSRRLTFGLLMRTAGPLTTMLSRYVPVFLVRGIVTDTQSNLRSYMTELELYHILSPSGGKITPNLR